LDKTTKVLLSVGVSALVVIMSILVIDFSQRQQAAEQIVESMKNPQQQFDDCMANQYKSYEDCQKLR
jgi:hypothetical protein